MAFEKVVNTDDRNMHLLAYCGHCTTTARLFLYQNVGPQIDVNVGGTIFTTKLSTLTRIPGSYLAAMFKCVCRDSPVTSLV